MKSKVTKIQILKKGILALLILAMILPSTIYAGNIPRLTLQESTALEKLMYGEIGSVVRKIEEHFKSNTTLYIVNETQLRALAEYVNNGKSCLGKNIELLNDITLSSTIDWVPIGNSYSEFAGTFNGNGHTISKLTYTCYENYVTELGYSNIGLFGVVGKSGAIKKVNVNNSNIQASGININNINHVGNIAGTNYGKLTDCTANKMPLNKTEVDTGTVENNFVGKLIGENKGEEISTSIKQQPKIDFTINGTKITGDFKVYQKQENEFVEITNFQNDINLKVNDVIRIEYTLDKYLYTGLEDGRTIKLADTVDKDGNITEEIAKENYPQLKFAAGLLLNPIEVTQNEVTLEDGSTKPQTKLVYEYEATELGIQNYENLVRIDFTKNINKENLYVYYSEDNENFNTGDKINITATQAIIRGVAFRVDTQDPYLLPEASVAEMSEFKRYPEGKEVIIKLTSAEKIQASTAPEIEVSFSKSGVGKYNYQSNSKLGNAKHIDATINKDGSTVWTYSYVITPGDEGTLNLKYLTGTITDLVGNTTDLTSLETVKMKDMYVDTTAPVINIITSNSNIDMKYDFNEDGLVNEADHICIKRYILGDQSLTDVNGVNVFSNIEKNGDLYNDGEINTYDSFEFVKMLQTIKDENITNKEKIVYTFTCNENLMGFDINDIKVNGGRIEGSLTTKLNPNGTYTYSVNIIPDVQAGNVGNLQVVIEQNACTDLVGHGNVRSEKTIIVDKKAPILLSLEAYVKTALEQNTNVTTEYYRVGDEINVVATFDEAIALLAEEQTLPELALQFSESGDAKGTVSGKLEGNKIVYTYSIANGDEGTVSIKSFTGTVTDSVGNETRVTKRTLGGDTITADNIAPKLTGMNAIVPNFEYDELIKDNETKRYGITSKTREKNTITFVTEYNENIYQLSENKINHIDASTAPVLKFKFGNGSERTAVFNKVEANKIYYTYDITLGDNGNLNIISLTGKVSDIAGNEYTLSNSLPTLAKYENSVSEENEMDQIIADTTNPTFAVTSTGINKDDEGKTITGNGTSYRKGSTVTINVTSSEYVYIGESAFKDNIPNIAIKFGEKEAKGTITKKGAKYENNKTIFTYEYTIAENDNGQMSIELAENVAKDIGLNANEGINKNISNINADTQKPYYNDQPGIEYANGRYKVEFNEDLYYLDNNNVVKSFGDTKQAPLLKFEGKDISYKPAVSNNVITYSGEYVNAKPYLGTSRLCDKAGNLYSYYKDEEAPTLKITSNIDEANKGDVVTYTFTWNESVTDFDSNDIQVTNGTKGEFKEVANTNGKVYTLKVNATGAGKQIVIVNPEVCMDLAGNKNVEKVIYDRVEIEDKKDPIPEDKTAPMITFNYTTTTVTAKNPMGATITTDEDAIISYSWDNENWTTSQGYVRSMQATRTTSTPGTYTLYAKATDKASNQSQVQSLKFTVVNSGEEIENPEIIFEDLTTVQVNGVKYVKVSSTMTTNELTNKMDKNALSGKTPEYIKLTSNNQLKTGSEITINKDTKYVVIVKGDVNCDGEVTFLGDIVMTNNYRIGLNKNLSTIQLLAADINNSGEIEFIPDIVAMNNFRLGKIKSL